jgi:hypothetical protein
MPVIRTTRDAALMARVVSRWPLRYTDGASVAADRPAHVRAGSGIAWLGNRIAIVQDDANFVALVDLTTREVDSISLPRGPGGRRQFGDDRGNKRDKLDVECCVVDVVDGRETLFAFGSGSTRARERVVIVEAEARENAVRVVAAPALYAALRTAPDFSGGELNVEGAVISEGKIRFFQRANGASKDGGARVSATGDLDWPSVMSVLGRSGGVSGEARRLLVENVQQYTLGEVAGTPLTFTDATLAPNGAVLYLATAEASPNAIDDGPVAGTALGVISGERSRSTLLVDASGAPFVEKAEGILLALPEGNRALAVLDADDPSRPSELCEILLSGPWWTESPPR